MSTNDLSNSTHLAPYSSGENVHPADLILLLERHHRLQSKLKCPEYAHEIWQALEYILGAISSDKECDYLDQWRVFQCLGSSNNSPANNSKDCTSSLFLSIYLFKSSSGANHSASSRILCHYTLNYYYPSTPITTTLTFTNNPKSPAQNLIFYGFFALLWTVQLIAFVAAIFTERLNAQTKIILILFGLPLFLIVSIYIAKGVWLSLVHKTSQMDKNQEQESNPGESSRLISNDINRRNYSTV